MLEIRGLRKSFGSLVAVNGLDAMTWRGVGLSGAVAPTLVLLGFAAVFGAIALSRFRWEEA